MIDISSEQIVTMAEAARMLPVRGGRRVHVATLHRWCTHGTGGVHLAYLKLGGQRVTSVEALQRFLDASTEADQARHGGAPAEPTTSRKKSIEAAERRLARA